MPAAFSQLLAAKCRALVYKEYGSILSVLTIEMVPLLHRPDLANRPERLVHIRFLAAPINPSDVNQVEGTYPTRPELPAVGGNEGVAEVLAVGDAVKAIRPGDWVLPAAPCLGTWREELLCDESHIVRIDPNVVSVEAAATSSVNPPTAYRMLKDYVSLKPGDIVVQNGANSAVGLAVIQMCKLWGIRTINIVRDRPHFEQVDTDLRRLGATVVVKAERLALPETKEYLEKLLGAKPILAFNCVGGPSATDMARLLDKRAVMVTYGAMSKKPIAIPASLLIFSDLAFRGFWLTAWRQRELELQANGDQSLADQRVQMTRDIFSWLRDGKLQLPRFAKYNAEKEWYAAIKNATSGYSDAKHLLIFPSPTTSS